MLGIDFPELVVIAVVALIVIGPEHLPKVARTMGHLWGRAQRYINGIKADISRDMALDELRQLQQKTQEEVGNIEQSIKEAAHEWEQEVKAFDADLNAPPQVVTAADMPGQTLVSKEEPRHEMTDELPVEPIKTAEKPADPEPTEPQAKKNIQQS